MDTTQKQPDGRDAQGEGYGKGRGFDALPQATRLPAPE